MRFADHLTLGQQHVFDVSACHLITQGGRSVGSDAAGQPLCRYFGDNGRKCPIGVLLAPDEYQPHFEGATIGNCNNQRLSARFRALVGSDQLVSIPMIIMLDELQRIHDGVKPVDWPHHLLELAKRFELSDAQLKATMAKIDEQEKEKMATINAEINRIDIDAEFGDSLSVQFEPMTMGEVDKNSVLVTIGSIQVAIPTDIAYEWAMRMNECLNIKYELED